MKIKAGTLLISITVAGSLFNTQQVFAADAVPYYSINQISAFTPLTLPETNRLYNYIYSANFFHDSDKLGLLLYSVHDTLDSSFKEIRDSNMNTEQNYVQSRLETLSNTRNLLSQRLPYINDVNAKEVLSNYLKAINAYKTANSYLSKFYINPTQYNYSMYLSNAQKGAKLASDTSINASKRYQYYMDLSLNMASPNR